MRGFFHGWKRKLGVVTLLLACAFLGAWLRTHFASDRMFVTPMGTIIHIHSTDSRIAIEKWSGKDRSPWSVRFMKSSRAGKVTGLFLGEELFHWEWMGFASGECTTMFVRLWTIPYWSIVLPMPLLSAYLILSKPRKPAAVTSVEDV